MQDKILTIAVPSYNAEKYLTETMPSILAAKYRDLIDLVIVNDGSTDMTREVAEEISKQYPEIVRVVNKENGGHGSAVNTGIEYAVGKYFKVVDADDWVDTENLDLLIEYLQETDVDNVLSPYYKVFVDENSSILNIEEYNEFTKVQKRKIYQADDFFSTIGQTVGMHTITIKTDILKNNKIKLSEKMFYVDMEYIIYTIPHVETIIYFEKPIYKYRLGTSEQSVNINSYIRNREMHKKVIFNIVSYYNELEISKVRLNVIKKQLLNLINKQWEIYFTMNNKKEAKQELIMFEKELLNMNSCLVKETPGLKKILVRKSNYLLFSLAKFHSDWRKK